MSSDPSERPNRYTQVIDLTTRGQRVAQDEKAKDAFAEPEEALPGVSVDDLPDLVRDAFEATGWPGLMPVQEKAIPYMLEKRDLIVQSRTGSGKTGAFLLPLFELLDPEEKTAQVLILSPTRELARQIHAEFERMREAESAQGFESILVYGGVRYESQNKALRGGAQAVIGTPGRVLDHLERGTFNLDALRVLILDEADEMLSMGFYPAMRQLKRYLSGERQSYMFSATMPPRVRSLAREFLNEPGFLTLSVGQVSVEAIDHHVYKVEPMEKDRTLARIIELENPDSAIIFANTKREVEYLSNFLNNYGYDADGISGDLTQKARERVMGRIRDGDLRFLVATDVAARGIDISDLSHVIQYDVPQDPEYFVHRAGRTARAGKTGTAIALCTYEDERNLHAIAHRYDIEMEKRPVPSEEDVAKRVSERMTVVLEDRFRDTSNLERERLQRFIPMAEELAREEPELIAMLIDDLYHELMHQRTEQPDADDDSPAGLAGGETRKKDEAERDRDRDRSRSGGRGRRR